MRERTIIFIGPQGSGKGTQAELLEKKLGGETVRFEAGKSLRGLAQEDSYTGNLVRASIERGELLPVFLSTRAFSESLVRNMKEGVHLILDGFPRTADQLPIFDSALHFYKREKPTTLYFNISDEEAMKRLTLRSRADDSAEGIRRRLAWTRKAEGEVLSWFKSDPYYGFVEINGEQSIEDMHADICAKLGL